MLIIVEHDSAKTSCAGFNKHLSFENREEMLLDFSMHQQELEKWCWAAIASSMASYYRSEMLTQCEVASRVLGFDCCDYITDLNLKNRCNQSCNLDEALKTVNCYSHWSLGKPCFERIQFEINNGRPVCCRIEWYKGDAHYIVISGYQAIDKTLYIKDSLHLPQKIKYDLFPLSYKDSGGVWTETYWTKDQLK